MRKHFNIEGKSARFMHFSKELFLLYLSPSIELDCMLLEAKTRKDCDANKLAGSRKTDTCRRKTIDNQRHQRQRPYAISAKRKHLRRLRIL